MLVDVTWTEWGTYVQLHLSRSKNVKNVRLFLPPPPDVILLPEGRYLELPRDGRVELELDLDMKWPWIGRRVAVAALPRLGSIRIVGLIANPLRLEVFDPFLEGMSLEFSSDLIGLSIDERRSTFDENDLFVLDRLLQLPRVLAQALKEAALRHFGLSVEEFDLDKVRKTYLGLFLGQVPPLAVLTDLRHQPALAEEVEEAYRAVLLRG